MNRISISRVVLELLLMQAAVVAVRADDTPAQAQSPPATTASPVAQAGAPARPQIRLFDKLEFRGRISTLPQWMRVLTDNDKSPIFADDFKLNPQTTWGEFKKYVLSLPDKKEQLKAVNAFWNRWPYRTDMDVYNQEDYWAIADEFRRNSGDCEDYSIAKYFTLKELGFSPDDLRIVIVRETIRGIAHAILIVYLDGEAWVLDNLSNALLPHTFYKHYDAQYSVNENFRWSYVKPKEKAE
ncbi:MAG: transglutaminase-like cysteine peptidase [Thermoguttaceae bacterium]